MVLGLIVALVLALAGLASPDVAAAPAARDRAPRRDAAARRNAPAPREFKAAILLGGDRASNDAALAGLDAAKKPGRTTVALRLPPKSDEVAAMIDRLAADAPDLLIGVGAIYAEPFRAAATRHPRQRFLLLDAERIEAPNVRSVSFRADEGSFLAGVAAGAESRRGRVGFVGGMDTPGTHVMECAYETGARWASRELMKRMRGYAIYVGRTPAALHDPAEAAALSRSMIEQQDVDVLYAAAGGSGAGVVAAARDARVKAIAADGAPGPVITSVRKRLDRAVERAVADVRRATFTGGETIMGVANGGVDLALPGALAPPTQKLVERARATIVAGTQPACVTEHPKPPDWTPRPES